MSSHGPRHARSHAPPQVRFWALPAQSMLYTAFVSMVRTMGRCGTWHTARITATGVGLAQFCYSMALDYRSRWLFARGRLPDRAAPRGKLQSE